ncbi:hypothetical protein MKW98_009637 [Papaver atlanticum]|uniref:Uncharacterized protein n=1 Tax=Papaver atlanticum TaxID=357466 RepID=A0AAD4SCD0_9MAGN|nr:hypothetical protein MKW98_009637 [Papaver atlanticum]
MVFDVDDEQKQQDLRYDDFFSQPLRKRNEADGDLPASFCCLIVFQRSQTNKQKKITDFRIQIQLHESNHQKNEVF